MRKIPAFLESQKPSSKTSRDPEEMGSDLIEVGDNALYSFQENVYGLRYRSSQYYYTDSSLWPCQNHFLKSYRKGHIPFSGIMPFFSIIQITKPL